MKLKLFTDGNTILSVQMEEKEVSLLYRRMVQYNKDLKAGNVEETSAAICDQLVVGTVTGYKGQTGLVYVWDPVKNRIRHITDGAYAVRAVLIGNKVYSLHYVSSWGSPAKFELRTQEYGCKDPKQVPELVDVPEEMMNQLWPENGKVDIGQKNGNIIIEIGDIKIKYPTKT